jgi:hypothetical protein
MSHEDTVPFITDKANPNTSDNISGTVDAQAYLNWLNEHGYGPIHFLDRLLSSTQSDSDLGAGRVGKAWRRPPALASEDAHLHARRSVG